MSFDLDQIVNEELEYVRAEFAAQDDCAAKTHIDLSLAPDFRGANLEIQSFRGNEWLLSGPAETGKTWATLWLLDSLLRETPFAKATLLRKL